MTIILWGFFIYYFTLACTVVLVTATYVCKYLALTDFDFVESILHRCCSQRHNLCLHPTLTIQHSYNSPRTIYEVVTIIMELLFEWLLHLPRIHQEC